MAQTVEEELNQILEFDDEGFMEIEDLNEQISKENFDHLKSLQSITTSAPMISDKPSVQITEPRDENNETICLEQIELNDAEEKYPDNMIYSVLLIPIIALTISLLSSSLIMNLPENKALFHAFILPLIGVIYNGCLAILLVNLFQNEIKTPTQITLCVTSCILAAAILSGLVLAFDMALNDAVMFAISLAMMIIGAIQVVFMAVGKEGITGRMKVHALGIVLMPPIQLYFSVWFATGYAVYEMDHRVLGVICFAYPIVVGLLKTVMLKFDYKVFDQSKMIEFFSLILADLPYRFMYIATADWISGIVLILVKQLYKFIKFPVLVLNAKKIQNLKDRIWKPKSSRAADKQYSMFGEPGAHTIQELRECVAVKLFFQQFNDMLSIFSVLVLLAISRVADEQWLSEVSDDDYKILMSLFAIEWFLDGVFMFVATAIIRHGLKVFEPFRIGGYEVYRYKWFVFGLIMLTYPLIFTIVTRFRVIVI